MTAKTWRFTFRALAALASALFFVVPAVAHEENDCLECHSVEAASVPDEYQVAVAQWERSVHFEMGIECLSCHTGPEGSAHEGTDPWNSCGDCHPDAVEEFQSSIHTEVSGTNGAPKITCGSCHGSLHSLVIDTDEASPMHPKNVAETCGRCHANPDLARRGGIRVVQPLAAYKASVHGRAVESGEHAATCSECHAAHDTRKAADPESRVNHLNVPSTCGTCHEEITKQYLDSVHGTAAMAGRSDSPVCTDCHGEHRIIEPQREDSPVYASNVPKMTCGRCHGDLALAAKYGMEGEQVPSYEDSFHGLASKGGATSVANCASCHGVHDILPSSDPRSHVSKEHIAETCGGCHPGAGEKYALGPVHTLPKDKASAHPIVYWARVLYLWLIWLTIGGMFVHNFLDLRRKALNPIPRPIASLAERRERLLLGFRVAHAALAISFIVLVITGFALKYPEAGWSRFLFSWDTEDWRGWIHRVAAVVMLAAFGFHAIHLVVSRRARRCIWAMRPSIHDVHELRDKVKWFFGKLDVMPKSPPVNYAEKAEYLALVWGTVVMAVTGFILWFENWSLANMPKWVSDLSTVVHFYEAILATLAILVWHFYFVFLDPLVYPMDTAWLTGREVPGRTLDRESSFVEDEPEMEDAEK
jgi:cytochrome b subunit of formate dehydrogenase/nitrate/TMAO reductase-like tetraheme cytochrome c subunit